MQRWKGERECSGDGQTKGCDWVDGFTDINLEKKEPQQKECSLQRWEGETESAPRNGKLKDVRARDHRFTYANQDGEKFRKQSDL